MLRNLSVCSSSTRSRYLHQRTCTAMLCRPEFNLYMKHCRSVTRRTNRFVTGNWLLHGNSTCRHLDLLTMVRFSLNIKTFCLYVIWENQIWAKIFCIPKNRHSRTFMSVFKHLLHPLKSKCSINWSCILHISFHLVLLRVCRASTCRFTTIPVGSPL